AREHDEGRPRRLNSKSIMGTADYLSPEQALNLHEVDIRADIYSLGATLYTLLAGRPPYHFAQTVTQKLMAHQLKDAPAVSTLRPDLPAGLVQAGSRPMARQPEARPHHPSQVAQALEPWCRRPGRAVAQPPLLEARGGTRPRRPADPETVAVTKEDTGSHKPATPVPEEPALPAASPR